MRRLAAVVMLVCLVAPATAQTPQKPYGAEPPRRNATVRVVAQVGPAVANVSIAPRTARPAPKRPTTRTAAQSHASAVVIDPAGFLLTNAHVLQPGATVTVSLPKRTARRARIVALLPRVDLALLKVKVAADERLPSVSLAQPGDVLIGETCIAIGNPFGLGNSVTQGVVSATGRRLTHKGQALLGGFLQTDAAINPGNSGGALVNVQGKLIGINTAIHAGGHGIGFAIPPERIRDSLARLSDPLPLRGHWLGWRLADTPAGVEVVRVDPNGPAAQAGIARGDRIVSAGPRPVDSAFAVHRAFLGATPRPVRLAITNADGARRGAVLEPRPAPWRARIRARLGIEPRPLDPSLRWWLKTAAPRGVVVRRVDPKTPAAAAGLRRGDVLLRLAYKPTPGAELARVRLDDARALDRALRRCRAGQRVLVELLRGKTRQVGKLQLR